MSSYFISPSEADSWQIASNLLAKELKSQWMSVEVETVDDAQSIHALSWVLLINECRLDGTLNREGDVVHLDGDVYACAAFAIWFRTIVPVEQELIFYDEAYSSDVALSTETNEIDLIEPFITS